MAKRLIVVMGPSGSGKSSVAKALANILPGASMIEGDDYHRADARRQMASGRPLSDAQRKPWVERLRKACASDPARDVVLACSALTPMVQDRLRTVAARDTRFVMLEVNREVLTFRMAQRPDHFMPASLLESQLDALSVPEGAMLVDAGRPLAAVTREIAAQLEAYAEHQHHGKTNHADQS